MELDLDELGSVGARNECAEDGRCLFCLYGALIPGLLACPARLLAQSRLDLCKSSDQSGLVRSSYGKHFTCKHNRACNMSIGPGQDPGFSER